MLLSYNVIKILFLNFQLKFFLRHACALFIQTEVVLYKGKIILNMCCLGAGIRMDDKLTTTLHIPNCIFFQMVFNHMHVKNLTCPSLHRVYWNPIIVQVSCTAILRVVQHFWKILQLAFLLILCFDLN
jgi:hypothetical protein